MDCQYKESEIGLIPNDWEVVQLSAIGKFSKGQGIRKDEAINGEIPCVRYGELYTRHNDYIKQYYSFITRDTSQTSKKLKTGDILFAGSGETKEDIGKCAAFLDDIEAYAGGDIVLFSPTNVNSLYLGYLLNAPIVQKQKASKGQGDAIVHISAHQLGSLQIAIPPTKSEQTAIATALSDTDALIESLEKLIAKKRNVKQCIIHKLLTPKNYWETKKIKEIVSTPVTDGPHETPQFLKEGIPFLSVNNLIDNRIDLHELRFISLEDHQSYSRKCKPQKNDILLGKAASVGKVAIVNTDLEFNIWSPIALIRPKGAFVPEFIYYFFQTNQVLKQIEFFTNSSSQGNIGMGDIEKIVISYPPFDEQVQIAKVLNDIDSELEALDHKLQKYIMMKQGMMQVLLNGKIRLL